MTDGCKEKYVLLSGEENGEKETKQMKVQRKGRVISLSMNQESLIGTLSLSLSFYT